MRARRLAILVVALGACGPSEDRARQSAADALARGERAAAIEAIEALHGAQPETPEAWLEQAQLWIRAGEGPRAAWLLERGVSRFPERADLRLALAETTLLVGDPARAEGIAREVPASAPQHPESLLVRARALLELGDLEAAMSAFRQAESERPESAVLRIPRVAALLEERRFDAARAALDEAYARFADEPDRRPLRSLELVMLQFQAQEALQRAGAATHAQGAAADDAARRELEQALSGVRDLARRAPDEVPAWQALTVLAIAGGRLDLAEPALEAALAENGERAHLYPLLAAIAVAKGDDGRAEGLLRDCVQRTDTSAARLALARFLAMRQRPEDAIGWIAEGLAARPDDELLRFSHAELLLDAGREPEAARAIERFEALQPAAPAAALLRARLLLLRGDAAEARARLERLAPELDTAATQYWLGRALEQSGDRSGAARRLRLAAARDPAAPGPWLELLRLARERGDSGEAAQAGAALVQRAPRLIDGWEGLVDAWIDLGERDAALATARRAAALLPDRVGPQLLLARALRASGRPDEALAELDAAASRSGDTPELAAERVLTLGLAGRLDAADAEARRAIAAHGDSAALHHSLAGAFFQAGRAQAGAAEVERALALAPDDLRPLALRCRFYAASGRFDAAVTDCERYLERHPDDAALHFALGVAQEGVGHGAEAEASYRRAAALDARAPAPRNNLALLLAARGDLDGALAAAQEAFAQGGENADVLDTLGSLYLNKGLVARAISLLEDAHARAPDLAEAQLHLALAYRAAGRSQDAQPLLDALRARASASPTLQAEVDAALARP
jgi:tetratricopeptide (TPR) repeat protein